MNDHPRKPGRKPFTVEERRALSLAMKTSEKVRAACARRRGIARPALSDDTRAKMSATRKAAPGTLAWQLAYDYYLIRLAHERRLAAMVKETAEP